MTPAFEPRSNGALFGHSAAEGLLRRCAARDRLHHAWLLTGPEGIGKATLAYRFARALLAGLPEEGLGLSVHHPVFRQVAAGSHPDLVTIALGWDQKKGRERKEIVLDDTERLFDLFSLTPANGGWRIVIIDGVDRLNRNASNALLKLLEEPPRCAIFLLTSSAPSRLPTTLRSRCVRLGLRPLDGENMRLALRHCAGDLDEGTIGEMVRSGDGSPGMALRGGERLASAHGSLNDLEGGSDPAATRGAIYRLLRDAMSRQDGDRPEPFYRNVSEWCGAWSSLGRIAEDSDSFNLDKDQLVLDAAQVVGR